MLRALKRTLGSGPPVIGVNYGAVGFLTSIGDEAFDQMISATEYFGFVVGLVLAMGGVTNTKIVPGHGSLATKADLQDFRNMLVTARDRVTGNGAGQFGMTVPGQPRRRAVAVHPHRLAQDAGGDEARHDLLQVLARPEFEGWTKGEWCLEIIQTALTSGKINFYPEYDGVIVTDLAKKASEAPEEYAKFWDAFGAVLTAASLFVLAACSSGASTPTSTTSPR